MGIRMAGCLADTPKQNWDSPVCCCTVWVLIQQTVDISKVTILLLDVQSDKECHAQGVVKDHYFQLKASLPVIVYWLTPTLNCVVLCSFCDSTKQLWPLMRSQNHNAQVNKQYRMMLDGIMRWNLLMRNINKNQIPWNLLSLETYFGGHTVASLGLVW
jgi:hypothetical protein